MGPYYGSERMNRRRVLFVTVALVLALILGAVVWQGDVAWNRRGHLHTVTAPVVSSPHTPGSNPTRPPPKSSETGGITFEADSRIAPPAPAAPRLAKARDGTEINWSIPGSDLVVSFRVYRRRGPETWKNIGSVVVSPGRERYIYIDRLDNPHGCNAYSIQAVDVYGNVSPRSDRATLCIP